MKFILLTVICFLSVMAYCSDFEILSVRKDMAVPGHPEKIEFSFKGDRDWCYFDKSHAKDFETIVVYCHSYGGDGGEIYTSELIYPLWTDTLYSHRLPFLALNIYGNSYMGPKVAQSVHTLLQYIKKEYRTKRFIFVGGSHGGTCTLIYTGLYPEDVYCAVALCPAPDLEEKYKFVSEDTSDLSRLMKESFDTFYNDGKGNIRENLIKNNPTRHTENYDFPLFLAHAEDDNIADIKLTDGFAEKFINKKDFKYVRYETGGHYRPSTDGWTEAWRRLEKYL